MHTVKLPIQRFCGCCWHRQTKAPVAKLVAFGNNAFLADINQRMAMLVLNIIKNRGVCLLTQRIGVNATKMLFDQ